MSTPNPTPLRRLIRYNDPDAAALMLEYVSVHNCPLKVEVVHGRSPNTSTFTRLFPKDRWTASHLINPDPDDLIKYTIEVNGEPVCLWRRLTTADLNRFSESLAYIELDAFNISQEVIERVLKGDPDVVFRTNFNRALALKFSRAFAVAPGPQVRLRLLLNGYKALEPLRRHLGYPGTPETWTRLWPTISHHVFLRGRKPMIEFSIDEGCGDAAAVWLRQQPGVRYVAPMSTHSGHLLNAIFYAPVEPGTDVDALMDVLRELPHVGFVREIPPG